MKKMLSDLLNPDHKHYRSVGELARTLQFLIGTAQNYRQKGRWGDSGPTETLCNYDGCTNHRDGDWHSGRIVAGHNDHLTTWQQNHDAIYACILMSLCHRSDVFARWRKAEHIHLHMLLRFPMAYQHSDNERKAWDSVRALHKHQLPIPTLNSCHKRINVLAAPELAINSSGIRLRLSVTQKSEMRSSPVCYSRWGYCFLTNTKQPKWNCQKETFADFLLRACAFYKSPDAKPARP